MYMLKITKICQENTMKSHVHQLEDSRQQGYKFWQSSSIALIQFPSKSKQDWYVNINELFQICVEKLKRRTAIPVMKRKMKWENSLHMILCLL